MADREDQHHHDEIVNLIALALNMDDRSANVRADTGQSPVPEQIGSHIPDLHFQKGSDIRVYEVETCDTVSDEHTADQWSEFYSYAHDVGGTFTVVVPHQCEGEANERLHELGLTGADVWSVDL